jgi:DNA-binding Xre family transcriptional regulator
MCQGLFRAAQGLRAMFSVAVGYCMPYVVGMTPIHLGRVKELRKARGWTQDQLAEKASIRVATLSAIENGQSKGVDFATLEALANAFDVDAGYLIIHERPRA